MMARAGMVGALAVSLLASSLGLGGDRADAQSREALVTRGRELFSDKGCYGCHTIGATGTPIGPDLGRAGALRSEATLTRWLLDPAAQAPTRHMPNLHLSEAEASALAAYLVSLP
jgi:mono/diheme cytochrome c family protein